MTFAAERIWSRDFADYFPQVDNTSVMAMSW